MPIAFVCPFFFMCVYERDRGRELKLNYYFTRILYDFANGFQVVNLVCVVALTEVLFLSSNDPVEQMKCWYLLLLFCCLLW